MILCDSVVRLYSTLWCVVDPIIKLRQRKYSVATQTYASENAGAYDKQLSDMKIAIGLHLVILPAYNYK